MEKKPIGQDKGSPNLAQMEIQVPWWNIKAITLVLKGSSGKNTYSIQSLLTMASRDLLLVSPACTKATGKQILLLFSQLTKHHKWTQIFVLLVLGFNIFATSLIFKIHLSIHTELRTESDQWGMYLWGRANDVSWSQKLLEAYRQYYQARYLYDEPIAWTASC